MAEQPPLVARAVLSRTTNVDVVRHRGEVTGPPG
jgi:hypothetical protein